MMRGLSNIELENVMSQLVADIGQPHAGTASPEAGIIEVSGDITAEKIRTYGKTSQASMVAVDGGSATMLDAGSFLIAGIRVGRAVYRNRDYIHPVEPEMHLLYLSASDIENAYSIIFEKTVGNDPPDVPRGLDEAVGRIRAMLEWKQVESILEGDISPGTVLAFDGALWAGIKGVSPMLARIVKTAGEKNIILCGISKKSMLTHNSRPLIPAVQVAGDASFPDELWHYPVNVSGYSEKLFGDIYVARLHPHSGYVFRIDLSLPGGTTAEEAFGRLAYHANDPTYVGYPYPLARVHNDVAFSRSEVEDIRSMLRSQAIRKGMDPKEWQLTFQNFHDVLDTNR
jgi:hypothetical protein